MRLHFILIVLVAEAIVNAQPYQPHVIWDRRGESDSSSYGTQILPLGDQNGDGFADWAVVAWGNIAYGGTQWPYVEFFHGADSPPLEPYHVFHPDTNKYHIIEARDLGDVNGDGFTDWLLMQPRFDSTGIFENNIYYGGPFPTDTPQVVFREWVIIPYPIGDFNGDGFADIFFYKESTNSARVYYGGNPMDTTADWVLNQAPPGLNQPTPRSVGDFNGDGASDFLCFNPNPPFNAAVFLGAASPDTVPAYFWSNMTQPLGGVKSLNGDADDELLFSALNGANVHFGRDSLRPEPDTFLNSDAAGQAVSAGDFNHDGFNDLILLTPSTGSNMFGALTVHLGHAWLYPNPAFEIQGSWPDGLIGIYAACGLGDVNGDGIDDIAIGAWDDFAYLGWRGRCIIIAGDDSLIASTDDPRPEIPQRLEVTIYPNPFNSEATIKLQSPSSQRTTTLTIFNVLGQEVRKESLPPFIAQYTYQFNAGDLPTGVYLAHVQSGGLFATQKLMLLK